MLIGVPFDNAGADGAGAVHLFSTTGTLLTVFTNPAPTHSGNFGGSVAALGTDWMLIGAWRNRPAAAFLFKIDSILRRK